ncbi:MAG: YicC/YloC family endoribonuclease [Syntrophobacteraceae bacterium]
MIYSMTGFGRSRGDMAGYSVNVEMRTLNGRQLDISVRLPKNFFELEDTCRKIISGKLRRGRVDTFIQIESTDVRQKAPRISMDLVRYYWVQLQDIHFQISGTEEPRLEHLLRIPHIYETADAAVDSQALQGIVSEAVGEALDQVLRMRAVEGESLLRDLEVRLDALRSDLEIVRGRSKMVIQEYQSKLEERMKQLLGGAELDENRLFQEIAFMVDRSDINEEMVRLGSHFDQIQGLLSASKPVDGRRLDFLIQELHREANTIGSKTTDLETTQAVIRMKTEIGKLKEQAQNIE